MPAGTNADELEILVQTVREAVQARQRLNLHGGASKAFYGHPVQADQHVDIRGHRGITNYQPSELVLRARAGTPLETIERELARQRQMLAFEPPHFDGQATLGGAVAAGLSGPRRPWSGAVRDFVLGVQIINGRGEVLNFGGQVMKNVAGFDVSRLMTGALGTLGLITEISLKVLPAPAQEYTLVQVCEQDEAIRRCAGLGRHALPLSGACWFDEHLYLRFSGEEESLRQAAHRLGDARLEERPGLWCALRDQQLDFFDDKRALWRLSVPPATPPLALPGDVLLDWGGAQRWLFTEARPEQVRTAAAAVGGHATLFRPAADGIPPGLEVFHPLPEAVAALQRRLREAFDPDGIFNPGRLGPGH
ncbi:MAG TPA: glycolate oxidase subunit GlcE [Gammaproteobacteria bacterium]|nr:glycolate oxidase subunit GlcE [Gammaproteobacteria bacterium]